MNYLLYCILNAAVPPKVIALPARGVSDEPLQLVCRAGLGAVVSAERQVAANTTVETVMAYGKVIEALQECGPLIPMRYGCRFESRLSLQSYLRRRCRAYKALLAELDDQVEMSIRILLPEFRKPDLEGADCGASRRAAEDQKKPMRGLAYLETRRRQYEAARWQQCRTEDVTGALCRQLKGLFKRSKVETTVLAGRQTPCLHFLVAKQSVAAFREAFRRQAALAADNHLLLSGPWPPYNFVVKDAVPGAWETEGF